MSYSRGRFTLIRNVKPLSGKAKQVAKIIPYDSRKPEESLREYEMLKNVRQEHIIRMFEAYHHNDFVILVLEEMYGENVARSLSLKNRYNEHQVASIIKQVCVSMPFVLGRNIGASFRKKCGKVGKIMFKNLYIFLPPVC